MKIQLLGAARTVTGSCYMVHACGINFTIDCGMHQGNKAIEERNFDTEHYNASKIQFILMTHAHIDHSGLLPRMTKDGFGGQIYCLNATKDLLEIMLLDSAHIQEKEAEGRALKYKRRGLKINAEPLYTQEDAINTNKLFHGINYYEPFEPHPGIKVTFYDAGHILGSAFVLLEVTEDDKTIRIVFSGDLGRPNALIVRDLDKLMPADYVFMESTYGDRDHKNEDTSIEELAEAIAYSYSHKEKVIIPAFAVERTQEILFCLHSLYKKGKIPADMPIYVDSPLAIGATEIFSNYKELFDEDAHKLFAKGEDPFELPNLSYTLTANESRLVGAYKGPAIVISASGMCNAGRIRHHLKHNLWKPGASIVFVGYQAMGTTGRKIVEKNDSVRLFGEDIKVAAKIFTINGFSAHAGQSQLLDWLAPAVTPETKIVLVHGEEKAQNILENLIKERFSVNCLIPDYLDELDIVTAAEAVHTIPDNTKLPRVDWEFLTTDIESKWGVFKGKLENIKERPWVEQTDLRERMEKMNYELTRLISGM